MNANKVLRTSEFWVGLVAAILQFLVAQGVLPRSTAEFVNMAATYVAARLISKAAKAAVPEGK